MTLHTIWKDAPKKRVSRKSKPQRFWTDEEISRLRELYRCEIPVKDIAGKMNRPISSVSAMAIKLGITNNRLFSKYETAYLESNYKAKTADEIADHLGRPRRTIVKKIKELRDVQRSK